MADGRRRVRADGVPRGLHPKRLLHPRESCRSVPASTCPTTLGRANDVRSTDGQGGRLVDLQRLPVNGVVCEYALAARPGSRPQRVLAKRVDLGTGSATRLARAASRIDVDVDAGSASAQCPSDSGSSTVIAFGYRDTAPADLWWHSTGCQTIDNGTTEAEQVANDSFDDFQTVFAETTRRGA